MPRRFDSALVITSPRYVSMNWPFSKFSGQRKPDNVNTDDYQEKALFLLTPSPILGLENLKTNLSTVLYNTILAIVLTVTKIVTFVNVVSQF